LSEFVDFCGLCGIALTKYEIAADIRGEFTLFDERGIGTVQITLCADCKEKVKEIGQGGLDKAIGMRIGIEGQMFIRTANIVQTRKDRDKDSDDPDDESGGIAAVPP